VLKKTSGKSARDGTPTRAAPVERVRVSRNDPGGHEPLGCGRDNVSRAYEVLRSSIISGELPAGGRIVERTVAARLNLSRTPVRSALHRLQQEGFIESSDSGTDQRLTVAPLTQNDGRDLFLLVGHLEGLAVRQAAELPRAACSALVRKLRALNRTLSVESRKRPGISRAYELDEQFHRMFVEDIAGPRLIALHRAIKPQTERYARLYVSVLLEKLPLSVHEHEVIIRAIDAGDARAAQKAVETNWHNAAARLVRAIAEHGERGTWHLKPQQEKTRRG
jgi:DNA-binding GntR family transcriptional regulator